MKLELKIESFQNSSCLMKFKQRKVLLMIINILQVLTILLMLGMLFMMTEDNKADPVFLPHLLDLPNIACGMEKDKVNWVRILMNILAMCLIPLLAWIMKKRPVVHGGVCNYPWGEESLLRKGEDGLWDYGPGN